MDSEQLETLIALETRYFSLFGTCHQKPFANFLDAPESPRCYDANHALRLRDDGRGAEAVAREVVSFYRSRGRRVVADVDAVAEAQGIGAALRRMGVTPVQGDWLLMRYPYRQPPQSPKRELEVVELSLEDPRLADWVEITLSDEEEEGHALWRKIAETEAHSPETRIYFATLEGQPAGGCSLFSYSGWSVLESVNTHPEMRRKGVGSAVVSRAVGDALESGSEVICLFTEAGGLGEPLYLALGFEVWGKNVMRRHLS